MSAVAEPNALAAFLIVLCAGLATSIGAAVVFFPQLVKLASQRVLAGSLGMSAGVMIYVSFVEIFRKSQLSFEDAGHGDRAHLYATLCFFGGVIFMMVLDTIVKLLAGKDHHAVPNQVGSEKNVEIVVPHCIGCVEDPVAELSEWQKMANLASVGDTNIKAKISDPSSYKDGRCESEGQNIAKGDSDVEVINANDIENEKSEVEPNVTPDEEKDAHEKKKLAKMGLNTAIAIALHNFPEGLATFIAALSDPKVGGVLAIAIAIHNIPEGLCVSLPIYYATGNRWKGFLWGFASGLSEPLAALLGWLILANHFTDEAFAVLFGLVSGMMVMISVKELLPTAHRYDPEDKVVSYSVVFGMGIMALSLVLFTV